MTENTVNKTLRSFLLETVPEYIDNVPVENWLEAPPLSHNVHICIAVIFLMICIPGNLGHLLVFTAYYR
jgi:hypothetical protein